MIIEFENRGLGARRQNTSCQVLFFQLRDHSGVDTLNVRRDILDDERFALGENVL